MGLTITYTERAARQIEDAVKWYEEQRSGLGLEFSDKVAQAAEAAAAFPEAHRIVRRKDGLRRVLVERFPYKLFYSVELTGVVVHSVWHAARHDHH